MRCLKSPGPGSKVDGHTRMIPTGPGQHSDHSETSNIPPLPGFARPTHEYLDLGRARTSTARSW